MNSFKSLQLLHVYRTENHNIYSEFYQPVLSHAIRYDRAVGFFSSAILSANLKGLSKIITEHGTIRLIIGQPLEVDEFNAIQKANYDEKIKIVNKYMDELLNMIQSEEKSEKKLLILGYLIATKKLEIKYALRRKGMYHEKIGIVYDKQDNIIVFQGSANETPSAFFEDLNSECISVYSSWNEEIFNAYGKEYIHAFENLWDNKNKNTIVLNVLSEQYKKIHDYINLNVLNIHKPLDLEKIFDNIDNIVEYDTSKTSNSPKIPDYYGINPFSIRPHQQEALNKWKANSFKGILKHATGSGKTVTALYALTKIFEAKKKYNDPLCVIISVPYIDLANQWLKEAKNFNIIPVQCYESKENWFNDLKTKVLLLNHNKISFLCILVVNKTLISNNFQEVIAKISNDNLMFIGDECHRHAPNNTNLSLPNAEFKLGLSATPFLDDHDEIDTPFTNDSKKNLLRYYENIVHEYSLEDAINDDILTPYNYYIIPTYLTFDEQEQYDFLSSEIGKILAYSAGKLSKNDYEQFTILTAKRSRLLGSATNKLVEFDKVIKNIQQQERQLSLVYVGEGHNLLEDKVIDEVTKILKRNTWKAAQFTSLTSKQERKFFLEQFQHKHIDALVAMKVLDEGIDVPACRTAFILASTKNSRQYIQRRGRVLRKYPGKYIANIYDFVILPCQSFQSIYSKTLKASEMERIRDFTFLATNKTEIESMIDILGL